MTINVYSGTATFDCDKQADDKDPCGPNQFNIYGGTYDDTCDGDDSCNGNTFNQTGGTVTLGSAVKYKICCFYIKHALPILFFQQK